MSTARMPVSWVKGLTVAVCAALAAAIGSSPSAIAAPDTTPPPTPTGFLINGMTDTTVSMQWSPGYLTEPTSWRVYRNAVQVHAGASSAYPDRNLTPGATYSYFVVAYDAAGNTSPPTRTITVTTRGPGVLPGAPTNLRVKAVSPARVTLEFDRPGDEFDVSQYRVYDGATQVATGDRYPYAGASTTVEIRGLVPGTAHTFTVRADRFGLGLSTPSNTLAVTLPGTTDAQPPSVPTGLAAVESSYACDFADLSWTQSTDNVDPQSAIDYEVSTDGVFNHYVRGTGRSPLVHFPSHGVHTITVRAVDSSGNASAPGGTATFEVGQFCPIEG